MAERQKHLVIQHADQMSRRILEEHQDVVRAYVKGKVGVYALYKKSRLYYVGLASNLRSRLKAHLKDRHGDAWDTFSIYLTVSNDHLRELEALVLRITMPKGNRSKTKFAKSQDLKSYFKRIVADGHKKEMRRLFGPTATEVQRVRQAPKKGKAPALAAYFTRRTRIKWTYKGVEYRATVHPTGHIRFKGRTFNSPSVAASHISKRPTGGWHAWRYEASPGQWEQLDALRKRPGPAQGKAIESKTKGKSPTLAGYFDKRTSIQWPRKDITYKATVLTDGRVQFQGVMFNSPSSAATHITKRAMNGWDCWRYKAPNGEWEKLDKLRKGKKR